MLNAPLDFAARRTRDLELARQAWEARDNANEITGVLADWIGFLRTTSTRATEDTLVSEGLKSDDRKPAAWAAFSGRNIPDDILLFLDEHNDRSGFNLTPFAAYVLGRAIMRDLLRHPDNTDGLGCGFEWAGQIDGEYLTLEGLEDESLSVVPTPGRVQREFERAVGKLASDPEHAVPRFSSSTGLAAVSRGRSPISLEASVTPLISRPTFEVGVSRGILLLARTDPASAVRLLHGLNNAGLMSAALQDGRYATDSVLTSLLAEAPLTFENDGRWTGSCLARLLLEKLENGWRSRYVESHEAIGEAPAIEPTLGLAVAPVVEVLKSRKDGPRLLLEWAAHSLWSLWRNSSPIGRAAPGAEQLRREQALMDALLSHLRHETCGRPEAIWGYFGGEAHFGNAKKSSWLPRWTLSYDKPDELTPLLLAILCCAPRDDGHLPLAALLDWLTGLLARLERQPHLHEIASPDVPYVASILAWPIALHSEPRFFLEGVWRQFEWWRTQARFHKVWDESEIARCVSVIPRIAVAALSSMADTSRFDEKLTTAVCDMVDELRYAIPDPEHMNWKTLVAELAAVIAKIDSRSEHSRFVGLLHRLDGDDDCTIRACVAAGANGLTSKQIAKSLAAAGIVLREVGERWLKWNARLPEAARVVRMLNELSSEG